MTLLYYILLYQARSLVFGKNMFDLAALQAVTEVYPTVSWNMCALMETDSISVEIIVIWDT